MNSADDYTMEAATDGASVTDSHRWTVSEERDIRTIARLWRKLASAYGEGVVHGALSGEQTEKPEAFAVQLKREDLTRLRRFSVFCGLDEKAIKASAGAMACLRQVKASTGKTDIAMDVLADTVPEPALTKWMKARLSMAN